MAKITRTNSKAALAEGTPSFSTGIDRLSIAVTSINTGLTYHLHLTEAEAHRFQLPIAAKSCRVGERSGRETQDHPLTKAVGYRRGQWGLKELTPSSRFKSVLTTLLPIALRRHGKDGNFPATELLTVLGTFIGEESLKLNTG